MTLTQKIDIDHDVYMALEVIASSSGKDYSTILRDMLSSTPLGEQLRQKRGSGAWSVHLPLEIKGTSIPRVLRATLLQLQYAKPGFLDKLSEYKTERVARRIVSRKREEVYPTTPHLIKDYCYKLNWEWYFHANISAPSCQKYLEVAASVAGIETPQLVDRSSVTPS